MAHRPSQTLREAFLLSRIGLGDKVVTKLYGTYLPADLLLFYTVFSTNTSFTLFKGATTITNTCYSNVGWPSRPKSLNKDDDRMQLPLLLFVQLLGGFHL